MGQVIQFPGVRVGRYDATRQRQYLRRDEDTAAAQGLLIRSNSRLRSFMGLPVLVIVLVAFSISCSGCLWLMVPSLAYQGYKYEHKHDSSTTSKSSEDSSSSTRNQSDTNSDSSIE